MKIYYINYVYTLKFFDIMNAWQQATSFFKNFGLFQAMRVSCAHGHYINRYFTGGLSC